MIPHLTNHPPRVHDRQAARIARARSRKPMVALSRARCGQETRVGMPLFPFEMR
jgi:hypothetical protein